MGKNRHSGKTRPRRIKERKCLVTGETCPTRELIRFVVDPEGQVIADVAAKLPGRGGWIIAKGTVLEMAMKKKTFVRFGQRVMATDTEKTGKKKITVADNLPELVVKLLRQRCLDYLGFANRAGLVVSGFEKVRARLRSGKCRALITAEDASADGRRKICAGSGNILDNLRMIDMFTREQLGQTLGLPNPVHVALGSGGITESFLDEFSKYKSVILQ